MAELAIVAAVVAVLVALNGLYVAAEFAIIAASPAALAKHPGVRRVLDSARSQDRYIATAQVGITVASLGLGMYGEHALAEWLEHRVPALGVVGVHAVATVAAVAVLTYLHIVVGEMVPKALALQRPERAALVLHQPMRVSRIAFLPFVVSLNAAGNGLLRLFGVRRSLGSNRFHSAEDLRFAMSQSHAEGKLRDVESRILQESLDFADADADDVMTPRVAVAGIRMGASPQQMVALVKSDRHSRYPVYRRDLDDVVGVVHIRDVLRAIHDGRPLTEAEVRPAPFVAGPTALGDVLVRLRRQHAHVAIVMDEHGGTAGILTIEDILEEIVGEIDEEEPTAPPTGTVAGTQLLEDVARETGRDVQHPEVDTVSGLVLALLGRPPAVGDVVEHGGLRFEVVAVAGRGVERCRVTTLEG